MADHTVAGVQAVLGVGQRDPKILKATQGSDAAKREFNVQGDVGTGQGRMIWLVAATTDDDATVGAAIQAALIA